MSDSFGHVLLNELLPKEHQIKGAIDKKTFHNMLNSMARKDPEQYVQMVPQLKRLGDLLSTTEGLSVGLDDIAPDYKVRDKALAPFTQKFDAARTDKDRKKIVEEAHGVMVNTAMKHPGSMTTQVTSGARGKPNQYAAIVATPTYARDGKGSTEPWLIRRSYSEGLTAADNWVAGSEAILNTISSSTSVSEPGELAKLLVSNMSDILITEDDCGTQNGVHVDTLSNDALDRYLARSVGAYARNTLVTSQNQSGIARASKRILVRSPMSCEAGDGVCQKCQGLDEKGGIHSVGTNVGVRAAQAMAEPLTQFALNAKHGVRTAKDDKIQISGVQGLRQIIESPQQFTNKATLAQLDGSVDSITEAPQGGNYVTVAGKQHYVVPTLRVTVRKGQKVQAGDALSQGVPKPDEVIRLKGLGTGRQYMVDTLSTLYQGQGKTLDKRHFELLARGELNHVRVLRDPSRNFVPGDIVNYNVLRSELKKGTKTVLVQEALGETLGQAYLHHYAGTRVTPYIVKDLQASGIKEVLVAPRAPEIEFTMKPASRAPMFNPDWLARLSHRGLKDAVMHAAQYGETSNVHGTHPVPAYVIGTEFGQGPQGRY